MNNYAHLKESCPLYPFFRNGLVPIKNILMPNRADCEHGGGVQDVYMVDVDRLTPEQWENVSRLVHQQCDPNTPLEVARKEMKARGLPVRAIHVSATSSDNPFFL